MTLGKNEGKEILHLDFHEHKENSYQSELDTKTGRLNQSNISKNSLINGKGKQNLSRISNNIIKGENRVLNEKELFDFNNES